MNDLIYEKWAKSGLLVSGDQDAKKKCRKAGLRFLSAVRLALLLENQLQEMLKKVKYE